ncbi:MAG: oligosaccharide flippase family protein [Nannocystis sp.]|uniref:oligosaccharide flippase family protein n=1 Tax=Nannocystis sp. TaxID=1962667 RepID=UPI0024285C2E|nr:oligosaccharide flippase family protein [Nannocystis sp.]MBK9757257.1 oligosaccharide flippase family protein [Nannocystis sp.]
MGDQDQALQRWMPRLVFSWRAARSAFHYGLKTLLSRLLYHIYTGLDYYVVGHYFGKQSLGLYKAACDLGLDPAGVLSQIVVTVAFPTFARLSDRPELLAQQFLQFARFNLMIVGGYICLVVVPAPDLLALMNPQWVAASGALRILGLTVVLRALSNVIPPLLDGVGRPALTLMYMAVASVVLPLCFLGGAVFLGDALGYESVAWSWFFGYPVAFAVLLGFGLRHARLSLRVYALAMGRIALWLGLALLCGVAARMATTGLESPLLRAAIVMVGTATVLLLALTFGEGITPSGIVASLKQGPAQKGEPA